MPVHGEPVGRRAVDDAEVDRLGVTPLVGRHLVDGQVPDFRRGGRVNVAPLMEGPEQRIIATDVGQHAQLDLAVVGAYQSMTGASRMSFPSAVRTGMFWRLGSLDDRRPVAVPARLKLVWTRPV